MLYTSFTDKNILVSTARWAQEASPEVTESFSMLLLTDLLMPFEKGLDVLFENIRKVVEDNGTPVLMRFFVSDPANQTESVRKRMVFVYGIIHQ